MAIQVSRFSEFASLFAEAEQNAKDLEVANSRIAELDATNIRQADTIAQLHSQVSSLEHELAEVARERDTFRNQYRDADALIASLRGDLDAAQSRISTLEAEVTRMKRESDDWMNSYDKEKAGNELLLRQRDEARAVIDSVASAVTSVGWTHPDTPIPVPEVASVPPTLPDPLFQHNWESPSPSEAPQEPQPADAAAPTEHGSSDRPDDGTWRSYY